MTRKPYICRVTDSNLSQGLTPEAFDRMKVLIHATADMEEVMIDNPDAAQRIELQSIGAAWLRWCVELRDRGRTAAN